MKTGSDAAKPPAELAAPSSSVDTRAVWIVPVRQPLILISQIQRSGGTLVCRLFDDHPECFTHPYELHWGRPAKFDWPALDLGATPAEMFETLDEQWVQKAVARGYYSKWHDRHPFLFDRALQRRIFESRLDAAPLAASGTRSMRISPRCSTRGWTARASIGSPSGSSWDSSPASTCSPRHAIDSGRTTPTAT